MGNDAVSRSGSRGKQASFGHAAARADIVPVEGYSPTTNALLACWDDDGATRGPAFIELRDHAKRLECALRVFASGCDEDELVPHDSPVTIRCQLGDLRRAWHALKLPEAL